MPDKELTPRERIERAEKSLRTNVMGEAVKEAPANIKPKGFKRGGKVKTRTGTVHKGEFVVKKSAAKAVGTKTLNQINRAKPQTGRKKR